MPHEMKYFTEDEVKQINQPMGQGSAAKVPYHEGPESNDKKKNTAVLWRLALLAIIVVVGAVVVFIKEKSPQKEDKPQSQMQQMTSAAQSATSEPTEQSTQLQGPQVSPSDWFMVLASPTHPLPDGFDPETVLIDDAGYYLDSRAAQDFLDMQKAATDAGMQIKVISAFRSANRQQSLYEAQVKQLLSTGLTQQQAEQQAQRIEQKQYQSDHNTGLAVDLVPTYKQTKDAAILLQLPEYQWLLDHAAEYGFILRYPEDKEDVTGVEFKPWHWRYVGKEMAAFLKDNNMTLDEYWNTYFNQQ